MNAKQPTPKAKSKLKVPKLDRQKLKPVFLALLVLLLGFGGGLLGSKYQAENGNLSSVETRREVINSEGNLITEIAKDVGQSVVSVNVTSKAAVQDFFGFQRNVNQSSAGTGFIVSEEGVVVTNRHVVPAGTTSVSVTLADGTELTDVEVIGRTNDGDTLDIAFLKIKDKKGKTLKAVKLADSSKVNVGERVVAIGNALGQFQNTVTSGIISGYGRDVVAEGNSGGGESLSNLFQTDAAINQGNSGGPLVNMAGEVIGVNTAVAAGGSIQNIGFAIPINDVRGLITSVLETGKLQKPYLGVRYVSLTDDLAYVLNLDTKRGAYIAPPSQSGAADSIVNDSPADKAGLKEKDIIVKVNDVTIDEKTSLSSALGRYRVGDEVELTIVRDGQEQKIKVKLEAQPEQ